MDHNWLTALRLEIRYEPTTGHFFWLKSKTGRRRKNPHAGCKVAKGYIVICFKGKTVRAHRLAWTLTNGAIPNGFVIDHINGLTGDNRIQNLRIATNSQNSCNSRAPSNNRSGLKGVCWIERHQKWKAQIFLDYKNYNIGYFDSKFDAYEAVEAKRKQLHGDFSRHH